MAQKQKIGGSFYEVQAAVPFENGFEKHSLRSDHVGIRNVIATWWLFPFHLAICGLLVVVFLLWLDEHQFNTGSPSEFFEVGSGLYQTQVNAILSLALVCIRLVGGSCTALLVWRTIFIMLEKRGISLAEITRLDSWRLPLAPMGGSLENVLWSIWALLVILLLWPPSFSAPLASSSLAWIPSTRIRQESFQISVPNMDQYADYDSFYWAPDLRYLVVLSAATMAAADPGYILNGSTEGNTRRFFTAPLPTNSIMNITTPYIEISLKWVDYDNVPNYTSTMGSPKYSDVNTDGFGLRSFGAMGIIRDSAANGTILKPQKPDIFAGKRYIWLRLGTMAPGRPLEDGSMPNVNTSCPTKSSYFGKLPNVKQYQPRWRWSDPQSTWVSTDCFIAAVATINAGRQFSTGCTVSSFDASQQFATCKSTTSNQVVQEDWLAGWALAFTSETLKYPIIQNQTVQFMANHSIDSYATRTLALGYHSAWNALMKVLGNSTEAAFYHRAEAVVQAEINRPKILWWLGMNATLVVSALLVYIAQSVSVVKPIRNTALGSMTMDLTEIAHSNGRTEGLCNAVTLNNKDKKLPPLIWKRDNDGDARKSAASAGEVSMSDFEISHCHRRVVFLHDHERQTSGPALLTHEQYPRRESTRYGE